MLFNTSCTASWDFDSLLFYLFLSHTHTLLSLSLFLSLLHTHSPLCLFSLTLLSAPPLCLNHKYSPSLYHTFSFVSFFFSFSCSRSRSPFCLLCLIPFSLFSLRKSKKKFLAHVACCEQCESVKVCGKGKERKTVKMRVCV